MWAALLPLLAQAGGSLLGSAAGGSREDQARALLEQQYNNINGITPPDIASQSFSPEMLQQMGQLDPRLEQNINNGQSELNNIQVDPRLRQSQLDALTSLQDISSNGGMTLQEKANMQKMLTDIGASDRGRRQAITQGMQQRGIAGSGLELAQQLQNAQDASQTASQQGLDIQAQAQQRALQALQQGGQLGGQIEDRAYGQKANAAQAQDLINRFNTQNQLGVQQRNTASMNTAQQKNLAEQQRVADTNVGNRNLATQRNLGLQQQQFQNQLSKANAATGAAGTLAGNYNQAGQNTKNQVGGIAQAGGRILKEYL